MTNKQSGCTVAPLEKNNDATSLNTTAVNLLDLARQVLERSASYAQIFKKNDTLNSSTKSCVIAAYKGGNRATSLKKVKCDNCEHFKIDKIGDGSGIGSCDLGIEMTNSQHGLMPLFRYVDRYCNDFSKIMD